MHIYSISGRVSIERAGEMCELFTRMESLFLGNPGFRSADLYVEHGSLSGLLLMAWATEASLRAFVSSESFNTVLERLTPFFVGELTHRVLDALCGIGIGRVQVHRDYFL